MATEALQSGAVASRSAPRRRLAGRLSAGHLLMVLAGLLGLVLTMVAIRAADETQRVAVAATEIAPGQAVSGSDLRWVDVRLTDELAGRIIGPDDVGALDGLVASTAIPAGELVSRTDFRPVAAANGLRAMSVPVDPARAVSGEVEPGDRIDVLVARGSEVTVIVAGAEVLDVHERSGALGDVDEQFAITIAVDVRESQLLTAAIAGGELVVTRATGAESAADAPPLVVAGPSSP